MTIKLGPSEFIGTKIIKQNMIFITRFYHKTKNIVGRRFLTSPFMKTPLYCLLPPPVSNLSTTPPDLFLLPCFFG